MDNRYESLEWSIIHIVSALIRTRNGLAAVLALIPVEARDIFQDYVANIQETIETFEIFLDNLRTAHMTQILYQMYH